MTRQGQLEFVNVISCCMIVFSLVCHLFQTFNLKFLSPISFAFKMHIFQCRLFSTDNTTMIRNPCRTKKLILKKTLQVFIQD